MTRDEFIVKIDENIRLIRAEVDFTQDRMASVIGVSKKTLVQIEKGRSSTGWSVAVAAATIFKDTRVVQMLFGGDCEGVILSLAFEKYEDEYAKTMGGKVWWNDVRSCGAYRIQKNIISGHFRLLDGQDRRVCSSFDAEYVEKRLGEMCESNGSKN